MDKFFISLLAISIVTGCGVQKISLFETEWRLMSMDGTDYSAALKPPTLTINQKENKVSGFAGCNRFFGEFEMDDQKITFKHLGATKMYCQDSMQTEDTFLRILSEVETYRIIGETLQFFTRNQVVMEFRKPV